MEPAREGEDSGIDSDNTSNNESHRRRRNLREAMQRLNEKYAKKEEASKEQKQAYDLPAVFNNSIETKTLDSSSDEDSTNKSPSKSRLLKSADGKISSEDGRDSPPLLEVELTASDEEEDGSVLELVIPMQRSRYQRVPSNSQPHSTFRIFCNIFCCIPFNK